MNRTEASLAHTPATFAGMSRRAQSIVFFLLVLGLCNWHLDRGFNANTLSRAAMVAAVVEHGTLRIDAYHHLTDDKALVDGHYYSEKAPLPALLVIPFWWTAKTLGLITPGPHGLLTEDLLALGGSLCGSLPLALMILFVWTRLRDRTTVWPPATMATLPFLGSFLFVYSGSFHGHLLAALFLLHAWDQRRTEHHIPSGLLAGAAVLSEYSLFVFPLTWVVQDLVQRRWGALRGLAIGGAPMILLLMAMNAAVSGSPFTLPYSHVASHVDTSGVFGMSIPAFDALWGLLFSFYRGLFTHAPVALLCMAVFFMRPEILRPRTWFTHPLIIPAILLILMMSAHSMWWGGWAFGPRHLSTLAVLILAGGLPLVPHAAWARWTFAGLCAWGLLYNLAAKGTTGYSLPTQVMHPFTEMIWPGVVAKSFTDMQWTNALGFSGVMGMAMFLLGLFASLRFMAATSPTETPR